MPWSFIYYNMKSSQVQSSPVKSSQVKPMCFYARKSASEITDRQQVVMLFQLFIYIVV